MSAESLREQIAMALADADTPQHIASWGHVNAVLAVLGEVTVTEEWAPQRRGRDVHPADVRHDRGGAAEWCFPGSGMTLVRRTVTTTRHVTEWEAVE